MLHEHHPGPQIQTFQLIHFECISCQALKCLDSMMGTLLVEIKFLGETTTATEKALSPQDLRVVRGMDSIHFELDLVVFPGA